MVVFKINTFGGGGSGSGSLVALDWQESVVSRSVSSPPGAPGVDDRYVVPSGATGVWSGHTNEIAQWNGSSWDFIVPDEGFTVWVEDEDKIIVYEGVSWVVLEITLDHGSLMGLSDDDHTIYLLIDGSRAMTGDLDLGSNKLLSVASGTIGTDGVNKAQLDAIASLITDHGGLTGLGDDDHIQYILSDGSRAFSGDQSMGGNKLTLVASGTTGTDAINKDQLDTAIASIITDHGALGGLGDDDHTIYILSDGTRDFTGDQSMGGNKLILVASGTVSTDAINKGQLDEAIAGTIMDHGSLSGLGDDDHAVYVLVDGTRAFTGAQSLGGNKLLFVASGTVSSDGINKGQLDDLSASLTSLITTVSGSIITDHGALGGLGDDDHTQYILVDGIRPYTGDQSFGGNKLLFVASGIAPTDGINFGQLTEAIASVTAGDITSSPPSTDNAVVRWDGTAAEVIQNSGVIIDDLDNVTIPGDLVVGTGTIYISDSHPSLLGPVAGISANKILVVSGTGVSIFGDVLTSALVMATDGSSVGFPFSDPAIGFIMDSGGVINLPIPGFETGGYLRLAGDTVGGPSVESEVQGPLSSGTLSIKDDVIQITINEGSSGSTDHFGIFVSVPSSRILNRLPSVDGSHGFEVVDDSGSLLFGVSSDGTITPSLIRSDGSIDFTGAQSLGGNKLTFVASGVSATDGINKGQLEDALALIEAGDIDGPGFSTDDALVRWDGITGTLIQNSNAIVLDNGDLEIAGGATISGTLEVGDGDIVIDGANHIIYDELGTITISGSDAVLLKTAASIIDLISAGISTLTVSGTKVTIAGGDTDKTFTTNDGSQSLKIINSDSSVLFSIDSDGEVSTGDGAGVSFGSSGDITVNNLTVTGTTSPAFIQANGAIPFSSNQSLGGNKLTFVASGTIASDAINKGQLDALAASIESGDIDGPGSSTDNAVVRWDGTSGNIIQNSGVIIDDFDNMTIPGTLTVGTGTLTLEELPGEFKISATNDLLNLFGADIFIGNADLVTGSGQGVLLTDDLSDFGPPLPVPFLGVIGNVGGILQVAISDSDDPDVSAGLAVFGKPVSPFGGVTARVFTDAGSQFRVVGLTAQALVEDPSTSFVFGKVIVGSGIAYSTADGVQVSVGQTDGDISVLDVLNNHPTDKHLKLSINSDEVVNSSAGFQVSGDKAEPLIRIGYDLDSASGFLGLEFDKSSDELNITSTATTGTINIGKVTASGNGSDINISGDDIVVLLDDTDGSSIFSITDVNGIGIGSLLRVFSSGEVEVVQGDFITRDDVLVNLPSDDGSHSFKITDSGNATLFSVDSSGIVFPADVVGIPTIGSSTDNAVVRWNGISGSSVQNSGVVIDDSDNVTIPGVLAVGTGTLFINGDTKTIFSNDGSIVISGTVGTLGNLSSIDYGSLLSNTLSFSGVHYSDSVPEIGGIPLTIFGGDSLGLTVITATNASNNGDSALPQIALFPDAFGGAQAVVKADFGGFALDEDTAGIAVFSGGTIWRVTGGAGAKTHTIQMASDPSVSAVGVDGIKIERDIGSGDSVGLRLVDSGGSPIAHLFASDGDWGLLLNTASSGDVDLTCKTGSTVRLGIEGGSNNQISLDSLGAKVSLATTDGSDSFRVEDSLTSRIWEASSDGVITIGSGTLTIDGNTKLIRSPDDSMTISGTLVTITNTVDMPGDVSVGGDLDIAGDTSIIGGLSVGGNNIIARDNHVLVKSKSDFPVPSGGFITLQSGTCYELNGSIVLGSDGIKATEGSCIIGVNAASDNLVYTGIGSALTSIDANFVTFNVGYISPVSGSQAFYVENAAKDKKFFATQIFVSNSYKIGTFSGHDTIGISGILLKSNSNGISLHNFNEFFLKNALRTDSSSGDFLSVSGTNGVFNFQSSVLTVDTGDAGIFVPSGTTIENCLISLNQFMGEGTYIDNECLSCVSCEIIANTGIDDSSDFASVGEIYWSNNTTATDIITQSVAIPVAGSTFTGRIDYQFENNGSGRLTYNGSKTINKLIDCPMYIEAVQNNKSWQFFIARNGVVLTKTKARVKTANTDATLVNPKGVVRLEPGDYIEVYAQNDTDTSDFTAVDGNLSIV
jgi:hypothetical protein